VLVASATLDAQGAHTFKSTNWAPAVSAAGDYWYWYKYVPAPNSQWIGSETETAFKQVVVGAAAAGISVAPKVANPVLLTTNVTTSPTRTGFSNGYRMEVVLTGDSTLGAPSAPTGVVTLTRAAKSNPSVAAVVYSTPVSDSVSGNVRTVAFDVAQSGHNSDDFTVAYSPSAESYYNAPTTAPATTVRYADVVFGGVDTKKLSGTNGKYTLTLTANQAGSTTALSTTGVTWALTMQINNGTSTTVNVKAGTTNQFEITNPSDDRQTVRLTATRREGGATPTSAGQEQHSYLTTNS